MQTHSAVRNSQQVSKISRVSEIWRKKAVEKKSYILLLKIALWAFNGVRIDRKSYEVSLASSRERFSRSNHCAIKKWNNKREILIIFESFIKRATLTRFERFLTSCPDLIFFTMIIIRCHSTGKNCSNYGTINSKSSIHVSYCIGTLVVQQRWQSSVREALLVTRSACVSDVLMTLRNVV